MIADRRERGAAGIKVLAFAMLAAVLAAVAVVAVQELKRGAAPSGSTAAPSKAGFEALKGRWFRPDGGYILEIRRVGADGAIDAAYVNPNLPNPIRVSKAAASQEGGTTKVFVELNDPGAGYPGCTYTLAYDPQHDALVGVYFQAATQERHDIYFERME